MRLAAFVVALRVTCGRFVEAGAAQACALRRRARRRKGSPVGERLVGALAIAAVSIAAASCGGAAPSAQPHPPNATLPSASVMCPPVSELDYYVPVPSGSPRSERSFESAKSPTVTCSYGDLDRAPRRSVVVNFQLYPPVSARRPAGAKLHRIHDVGTWAFSYRKGHVTHVVVDQGDVAVSVSSSAGASDLLGLAEEELSRLSVGDRS
jgi:hypothetical protein